MEQFSNEPNINDFTCMMDSIIDILQKERQTSHIRGGKINLGFVKLQVPENLVIVGDLHGDIKSLFKILYDIDFEYFLANYNNKLIFLGDYVDRGNDSIAVLYTVCYLKQRYPDSVILMRGNHEAPLEFPFSAHDLPHKISTYFGKDLGQTIYKKILSLFQLFPLVTIIENQLLLVHGGLPTAIEKEDFQELIAYAQENHKQNRILEELLWSDPRSDIRNGKNWEESRRGIGRHFGMAVSRKWLDMSGAKVIVRGHEPCAGFKIDHDGMVMTLFSCKESYPKFEAAYIFVSGKQLHSICNAVDLACYTRKLNTR